MRLLRIDPDFPDAHANLGLIAETQGHTDEAILEDEQVVRLEGDSLDLLRRLAKLYAIENRPTETSQVLQRILRLDPQDPFANRLLEAMRRTGLLKAE